MTTLTQSDLDDMRRTQAIRKEHAKQSSMDYAEGVQCLIDCDALLDHIAQLTAENARLQARVSELEAAVETATPLIGARNDVAHPAIKEANINEAWHVLNKVRLPAPPVGDR